ncbi:MAG: tRNA (N(6)-L-threonylcarbamoyladenosine(37)-C(2))-methylthiotransferase [Candidatus Nanoarchaeia archaeon]|nr:tRNA (N(6)-L-threonylcarbamoyladenosine(37)-C(2))-methylthiotransferase [Candidatus Nanoarchaeia archaeon]
MARIKLIAFGCSNNLAESEIMAGLLKEAGHDIVDSNEDIAIISICNVKGPSFNKGLNAARKAKEKVIFAGCVPSYQLPKIRKEFPSASVVSTHNIALICGAVEELLKGKRNEIIEKKAEKKICLPRIRKNKAIGILPVSTGCLGQCSYCAVKAIKGELISYPAEDIVKEVENAVKEGCREIWITAQDTGCYGMDIGSDLPSLLSKVLEVKGEFKVRLGMANPGFVKEYANELIKVFKNEKMFRFLHIPIQSGSSKVLNEMNRHYTAGEIILIVEKFRKAIPDIAIATDIIVGFPSETEKDFLESVKIIKKIKPSVMNLNRYWAMPFTKAGEMKQLRSEVLSDRCSRMLKVFRKIALDEKKKAVGKEMNILIDGKRENNVCLGRTDSYALVVAKGKFSLGQKANVKIKKATANYLIA